MDPFSSVNGNSLLSPPDLAECFDDFPVLKRVDARSPRQREQNAGTDLRDRAKGALWGLVVGDCLGSPVADVFDMQIVEGRRTAIDTTAKDWRTATTDSPPSRRSG